MELEYYIYLFVHSHILLSLKFILIMANVDEWDDFEDEEFQDKSNQVVNMLVFII